MTFTKNTQPILLIGLTPQGLSMLRLLSRAGHNVIAFTNTKRAVGYYSKYGEKHFFCNIEELKSKIHSIIINYHKKLQCIISSGEILSLILNNYPELYEQCEVQSGPFHLIKKLSNKIMMYDYAHHKGLKYSKHTILKDYKNGDLKFPVILKRNIEIPLFFKTQKINTPEELNLFITKIGKQYYPHIIIQELITSTEFKDISFQAYVLKGTIKGYFICYQVRRLPIGITSYLEEIIDNQVTSLILHKSLSFFKGSGYTGFCELEFMYNPFTGELFFIEINTRTCGLHSVLNKKFQNLSDLYSTHETSLDQKKDSSPICWVNFARDIKARLKNKDFSNIHKLFSSTHDIWDKKDIKPFFSQFLKHKI